MDDDNDILFEKIELKEDEQQIFHKLKECNEQLQDPLLKNYDELIDLGRDLSFDLYTRLTSRGIEVKFNKYCLRNRSRDVGGGPEIADFHKHSDVIRNIIEFIEFKHAHDEVGDVTLGITFNFKLCSKRRLSSDGLQGYAIVSFTRTLAGWKCMVWERMSDEGKHCSKFLENLGCTEACILPETSVLGDVFERLWNDAAEGMEPGTLRRKLEEIIDWISLCEKGRPNWV